MSDAQRQQHEAALSTYEGPGGSMIDPPETCAHGHELGNFADTCDECEDGHGERCRCKECDPDYHNDLRRENEEYERTQPGPW